MRKLISILTLLAVLISGCGSFGKQAQPANVDATAPPVRVTKATTVAETAPPAASPTTASGRATSTSDETDPHGTALPSLTPAPSEATTAVSDENGLDMELGSVRVSAPAGVAATGTSVSLSTSAEPPPSEADKFSSAVGEPVRLVLEDGQQPQQPVTIVFDLSGTELAAGVSPESPLAVLSRSEESGGVELMPAEWDAQAQTLTVVTEHLSWFWPIQLDISKLIQPMIDTLNTTLGLRYPAPSCFGERLEVGSDIYTIEPVPGEVVWPCLTHTNGQIVLELHANSPLPWRASTTPSVPGDAPITLSASGLATAAIYRQLYVRYASKESIVVPGGSTSFRFDPANPPSSVSVETEALIYLVAVVAWGGETAFNLLGVKIPLLKSIAALDCLAGVVETAKAVKTDSKHRLQHIVSSTFNCLQLAVGEIADKVGKKAAAFVATVLISSVGLIVAGIQNIVGEILQANTVSFSILRQQATTPTPTLRDDAIPSPYVGIWEGIGFQYNNQHTWSIRMTLDSGQAGSLNGAIEYPSLQCGGELTLLRITDTFIELHEDITYGGNCVDNGTITMRLTDEKTADWKWSYADGTEGAESTLTKTTASTASGKLRYQVKQTDDGFVVVRERATTDSPEQKRLAPGDEITCEQLVEGQQLGASNQWADCPEQGGYIFAALLIPLTTSTTNEHAFAPITRASSQISMGRCRMEHCSWSKWASVTVTDQSESEIGLDVALYAGVSEHADGDYPDSPAETSITWEPEPHNVQILCSYSRPSVTFDSQTELLPLNKEDGVPGFLESAARLYFHACHSDTGYPSELIEKYGYNVSTPDS
jgi:hypothetical protein